MGPTLMARCRATSAGAPVRRRTGAARSGRRFGDEREELPVDPQHRGHRHDERWRRLPHDAGADVLRRAQAARRVRDQPLHEHRLRLIVDVGRDEADGRGRDLLGAVAAQHLNGQPHLQAERPFNRHVDVQLQRPVLIDRRQHRSAWSPGCRRGRGRRRRFPAVGAVDREVAQLDDLLLELRLQRLEIGLGGLKAGRRLLLFLLADRAGRVELRGTLGLLPRERDRGFARRQLGLLSRDGRLLSPRIDLDDRCALRDLVSRFHEDLRDLTVDLRLDGGRAQRPHGRDVFGGLLDRRHLRGRDQPQVSAACPPPCGDAG